MIPKIEKKKLLVILLSVSLLGLVILIGVFFSLQLKKDKSTSPTNSEAADGCKEECPSKKDGVLRSCTPPEGDGTSSDSLCNKKGRLESCGGKDYCCAAAGGKWTLCSQLTPTPTPKPNYHPADYNKSGKVEIGDFSLFAGYYQADDLLADLDESGDIGITDFVVFREAYLADNN